MTKPDPALYASPIDLPAARSGKLAVEHFEISGRVDIIGTRQALLTGRRQTIAQLAEPRRCHRLVETGVGVWMTDLPEELNQIAELLTCLKPRGHILIGGLGLGILAKSVSSLAGVDRTVVVELSPNVIKLCADSKAQYEVIRADVAKFVVQHPDRFDFYLLDTWQGTNEGTWWDTVMPLRRSIRRCFGAKPKIWCWAEDIMCGQIGQSLMNTHNPENPRTHWYYRGLPRLTASEFQKFWSGVGLPWWEKKYGATIDATIKEMKADHEPA